MGDERTGVVVLGSTGSVGTQALQVLEHMADRFRVVGLSANANWSCLAEQALRLRPSAVAIGGPERARRLAEALDGSGIEVLEGLEGLSRLAAWEEAQVVLSAVSGPAGLPAAVAALRAGKRLALANKEAVVMAGPLLTRLAQRSNAQLLPVDSEHSALHQLLERVDRSAVRRVFLTASGGPFRDWPPEKLRAVTPQQALRHPTWRMGRKITVDSATLMNKALEVIEARWLFDLEPEAIGVLIHPQSVVHCLVELVDGTVLAHMGAPDMRLPIQHALCYPERVGGPVEPLDLVRAGPLEFMRADPERWPALRLGFEVARLGGTAGAALCGANEAAVEAFLAGRIGFTDIVPLAEAVLRRHRFDPEPDLDGLMDTVRWARREVNRCLCSS